MLIIEHTKNFRIEKPAIVTIGTFDGVHLGHQKILSRLFELKQSFGLISVVLTFSPHPRKVLFPQQSDLKLLTLVNEKINLLKQNKVDVTVIYPFDKEFSNLDPEVYIQKILLNQLNVKHLIIGYDHKFGKNREGDMNVLKSFSNKYNYALEEISPKDIDSINISSSKIRHALEEGNVELASIYLGYDYSITGKVIKGKQLGHTIGYPTANLQIKSSDKLLPKNGVYFVKVALGKKLFYGMMNIGTNPTVTDNLSIKPEVNIFDFNEDIYGANIEVKFVKRLRDEKKFNNLNELIVQLNIDKQNSLDLAKNLNEIL